MKLEESIYPYSPEASSLPFRLTGIGGSEYQGKVIRPDGYHWHQILYCAGGKGSLELGTACYELAENCLCFIPKNTEHIYYPLTEKWDVRWITFDGNGCDEILTALEMDKLIIVRNADEYSINRIFDKMVVSQKEDILYCGYECSGLVYNYILLFHRYMDAKADSERSRKFSSLLPALRYIHDHFNEDFPLTQLAELVGVTPQHLCRLFRDTLNMRPTDYLLGRRIDEAKRLLTDSDLQLSEIASRSGFNNSSYFSTVFRKHEGISPAAYRKRLSKG